MKENLNQRFGDRVPENPDFCIMPSLKFRKFMEEECDADPRVAFAKGRKKFGGQPDERSTAKARQIYNPFEKLKDQL